MRINSISLINFRCFDVFETVFDPNLNVIVGNNGTGKTALLHGLSVSLGAYLAGLPGLGFGSRPFYRKDIRLIINQHTHGFKTPVKVCTKGVVSGESIKWCRTQAGPGKGTKNDGTRAMIKIAKQNFKDNQENTNIELPMMAFYATSRINQIPKPMSPNIRKSRYRGYHNALDETCNFKDLIDLLKNNRMSHLTNVIKHAIIKCLDGCVDLTVHPKAGILIHFLDGRIAPLSRMSDGYETFLAVVGDIARRCFILNPQYGKKANYTHGVVLIDEVDLHLHPTWQSKIVRQLQQSFPNIQFFLTTHSPFIIQSLRKEQLLILDPDIEKGSDPFRKSIEDVLQIEMGVDLEKRSELFNEMVTVANEYFLLIKSGKSSVKNPEVALLRERLNNFEERFGEDPAFIALLKAERKINGI